MFDHYGSPYSFLLRRYAVDPLWRRLDNIHPNSTDYEFQKKFMEYPVLGPWYRDYIVNKSTDERNRRTLSLYGYNPVDMTYPHLTSTTNTAGSLGRGYTMISHNITGLYAMSKISKNSYKKDKKFNHWSYN